MRGRTNDVHARWLGAIAACVVVMLGCAHRVPQDRATGPDGRHAGAVPITLDGGEGRARGVVTYPGGDRVDWKKLELPAGQRGRLDLRLTWRSPRPGLQLAFDVFDASNARIATARGRRGRARAAHIVDAHGTYFVRVYARNRGDAGAYRLTATFRDETPPPPLDLATLEISPPPRLPAVPGMPCEVFDPRDPECKDVCPETGAPRGWKACAAPEPPPPPPPPPPPERETEPPPAPVIARAIGIQVMGDHVRVTLAAGALQGVTASWKGALLRGDTTQPYPGGAVTIVRVDQQRTVVQVRATTDIVNANPRVQLVPP